MESVPDARECVAPLKREIENFNTLILPTHDPRNARRLREFRPRQ